MKARSGCREDRREVEVRHKHVISREKSLLLFRGRGEEARVFLVYSLILTTYRTATPKRVMTQPNRNPSSNRVGCGSQATQEGNSQKGMQFGGSMPCVLSCDTQQTGIDTMTVKVAGHKGATRLPT